MIAAIRNTLSNAAMLIRIIFKTDGTPSLVCLFFMTTYLPDEYT